MRLHHPETRDPGEREALAAGLVQLSVAAHPGVGPVASETSAPPLVGGAEGGGKKPRQAPAEKNPARKG